MAMRNRSSKLRTTKGSNVRTGDHDMSGINLSDGAPRAGKIKVRYVESRSIKDMRKDFEIREKHVMRSSKAYR